MGFEGFGGTQNGATATQNRWTRLLKARKGHDPEEGFEGFGGAPPGPPRPVKTGLERSREAWLELFSGGDGAGAAEVGGSTPPASHPPGRWTSRFKERKHPSPPQPQEVHRYEVVDQPDQGIEGEPITTLNDSGLRIKVHSRSHGTDLWLVPDGDHGPGDGLPVFTVAELLKLWEIGAPDPKELGLILEIKLELGGEVTEVVTGHKAGGQETGES